MIIRIRIKTPALTLKFIYWGTIGGSPPKPKNADSLRLAHENRDFQNLRYLDNRNLSNITDIINGGCRVK